MTTSRRLQKHRFMIIAASQIPVHDGSPASCAARVVPARLNFRLRHRWRHHANSNLACSNLPSQKHRSMNKLLSRWRTFCAFVFTYSCRIPFASTAKNMFDDSVPRLWLVLVVLTCSRTDPLLDCTSRDPENSSLMLLPKP